jgi:asparagine N-glycosylation enzyme membrane subunit Stt3
MDVAAEAERQPIEVERVRDEERFFGGDIVWWTLLLIVSIPIILLGLSQTPDTGGFLALAVGGVLAGIGFAQVMLRMPYFTNGFVRTFLIVLVVSAVIAGVALVFNMTLPVPEARPDVMYKPPISGG